MTTTSEQALHAIVEFLRRTESHLARLADHFDPAPPDKVGTPYVAGRLGCTTDWIAVLVREGEIPPSCVVLGSGNGRPWRFYRRRVDEWIENR